MNNGHVVLPGNLDAEEQLIGSLIVDHAHQLDDIRRFIPSPEVFRSPIWSECWQSICRLADTSAVNLVLVLDDLSRHATAIPFATIEAAVIDAMPRVITTAHTEHYARLLYGDYTRRRIIQRAAEATKWAYAETDDVAGMAIAVSRMFELDDESAAIDETGSPADAFAELDDKNVKSGPRSGLEDYDDWTGGMVPGRTHVWGGYTGIGKSWLACHVTNALLRQNARVVFFSLEMGRASIMLRLLANRIGSFVFGLSHPGTTWPAEQWTRYREARAELLAAPLHLYTQQRNLAVMTAIVRRLKPAVAFVDYVQLMEADMSNRNVSSYERVSANANGLYRLAQKAGCCIVVLSQMSNDAQRAGPEDAVIGYKGSGDIAQMADLGLLLLRPEDGVLKLLPKKNRHGFDAAAGAQAEYLMDRTTGQLRPRKASASAVPGRKPDKDMPI